MMKGKTMTKQMISDAGTPMTVTGEKSGNRIYFSCNISKARACWDTIKKEWVPMKGEFGHSMKSKIATAFEL
jgi:hypothetical protein